MFPLENLEEETKKIIQEFFRSPKKVILKLIILNLLEDKESHGYQIMKTIEKNTQSIWKPSHYLLYKELARLEDDQLIKGKEDHIGEKSLKQYKITKKGFKQSILYKITFSRLFESSDYEKDEQLPFTGKKADKMLENIKLLPYDIKANILKNLKEISENMIKKINTAIDEIEFERNNSKVS